VNSGNPFTELDDPSAVNGTFANAITMPARSSVLYRRQQRQPRFPLQRRLYFNLDPTGVGGDSEATASQCRRQSLVIT